MLIVRGSKKIEREIKRERREGGEGDEQNIHK